jgi:hypothetical protein
MSQASILAGGNSLAAIIQVASSLISVCKGYIDTIKNAPNGLKLI